MEDFKQYRFFHYQNYPDVPPILSEDQMEEYKTPALQSFPLFPAQKKRPITIQDIEEVRKVMEVTHNVLLVLGELKVTNFERDHIGNEIGEYLECLFLLQESRVMNYFPLHEHIMDFKLARPKKNPEELTLVTLGYDFPIDRAPQMMLKHRTQDHSSFQTSIRFWNFDKLKNEMYAVTRQERMEAAEQTPNTRYIASDFGSISGVVRQLPRFIPLILDFQPNLSKEVVPCLGLSPDMSMAAVALRTGQVILCRAVNLALSTDKQRKMSLLMRPNPEENIRDLTGAHIYTTKENNKVISYVYILAEKATAIFRVSDKREERVFLSTDFGASRRCSSVNDRGELAIVRAKESLVNIFNRRGQIQSSHHIDGNKFKIAYYRDSSIAVITMQDTSMMMRIFDLENKIVSFMATYAHVKDIDCGLGAHAPSKSLKNKEHLFLFGEKKGNAKILQKLEQFTTNEKLAVIQKRQHYDVAYKLASNANFDQEYLSQISAKHADFLYDKSDYNEALIQYKRTIGFVNPSYVIQKYLEVQKLDNLIDYLEELIQHHEGVSNPDKNRDYTALLLNCYVKQKKTQKLKGFADKIADDQSNSIFDVQTAIDVCRQTEGNAELAISLAEKTKQWDLMVLILVENKTDYYGALNVIEKRVKRVLDKIRLLKQHANEFLRGNFAGELQTLEESQIIEGMPGPLFDPSKLHADSSVSELEKQRDHTYRLVEKIARFLINHELKNPQPPDQQKWELPDFAIKAHELLPVLIDQPFLQERLLSFIIKEHPECHQSVYHSLIELFLRQLNFARGASGRDDRVLVFQNKIVEFMRRHSNKCDKNHVLFLFQVYKYELGIKEFCEQLQMHQELLNFYMTQGSNDKVLALCKEHGQHQTDLWVQALTYFVTGTLAQSNRRLGSKNTGGPVASVEDVEKALQAIGEKDLVNVSVVLELLGKNKTLPLKCAKKYLSKRMETLQKGIVKNQGKVDAYMEQINKARTEVSELKSQAKLFQARNCSRCDKKLQFPTIHFLCGHSFHEYCLDDPRECQNCSLEFTDKLSLKNEFINKADDHEQYINEVRHAKDKFKTVAKYYGRGLFSEELLK